MRILLKVHIPVEAGNKGILDGTLPQIIGKFVETYQPEAVYFTPEEGRRTAYFVLDMTDSAELPSITEPFFQGLGAEVHASVCMNLEDMRAGVAKAHKAP